MPTLDAHLPSPTPPSPSPFHTLKNIKVQTWHRNIKGIRYDCTEIGIRIQCQRYPHDNIT